MFIQVTNFNTAEALTEFNSSSTKYDICWIWSQGWIGSVGHASSVALLGLLARDGLKMKHDFLFILWCLTFLQAQTRSPKSAADKIITATELPYQQIHLHDKLSADEDRVIQLNALQKASEWILNLDRFDNLLFPGYLTSFFFFYFYLSCTRIYSRGRQPDECSRPVDLCWFPSWCISVER